MYFYVGGKIGWEFFDARRTLYANVIENVAFEFRRAHASTRRSFTRMVCNIFDRSRTRRRLRLTCL